MSIQDVAVAEPGMRTLAAIGAVLGAAALYTIAMVLMKMWSAEAALVVAPLIAVAMVLGCWFEIEALREGRLGLVYVMILGAECVMVLAASHVIFGERFTMRETAGAAMIALGAAIAWS